MRLADNSGLVVGVDTHLDSHTAALCDWRGRLLAQLQVPATAAGLRKLADANLDRHEHARKPNPGRLRPLLPRHHTGWQDCLGRQRGPQGDPDLDGHERAG